MKKVLLMLILMVSSSAIITSCKKENEKTEKEKNLELLVSGKWYYQSYKTSGSTTANTCFTASNYWEFKTDGTFAETWDFGTGTYSISEDGKTISAISGKNVYTISVTNITETNFSFTLTNGKASSDFVLAKTALNCMFR